MQLGSVWGHGAYRAGLDGRLAAPRAGRGWTAAREAHGQPYAELPAPAQAALRETLKAEYRGNRVNADEVLTVSARARPSPRPPLTMTSCFPMRRRCTQAASISR